MILNWHSFQNHLTNLLTGGSPFPRPDDNESDFFENPKDDVDPDYLDAVMETERLRARFVNILRESEVETEIDDQIEAIRESYHSD